MHRTVLVEEYSGPGFALCNNGRPAAQAQRCWREIKWLETGEIEFWNWWGRAGVKLWLCPATRTHRDRPGHPFRRACDKRHPFGCGFMLELLAAGQAEGDIPTSYPGLMHADILACLSYASCIAREYRHYRFRPKCIYPINGSWKLL